MPKLREKQTFIALQSLENLLSGLILYTSEWHGPGVPNLKDLMPDYLRWSWCNNKRNKVHDKHNELESFQNPPTPYVEKLSFPKPVPGDEKIGDRWSRESITRLTAISRVLCFVLHCTACNLIMKVQAVTQLKVFPTLSDLYLHMWSREKENFSYLLKINFKWRENTHS